MKLQVSSKRLQAFERGILGSIKQASGPLTMELQVPSNMALGHKNKIFSKWNFTFHHNTASGHKYKLELGVSPHSHMASGQIFIKQNFQFYQIWLQAKFLSHETSGSIKDDFMSNLYEMELQVPLKMTLCQIFNQRELQVQQIWLQAIKK